MLGRIAGVATVDVLATLLAGLVLSKATGVSPTLTVPGLFVVGHMTHMFSQQEAVLELHECMFQMRQTL